MSDSAMVCDSPSVSEEAATAANLEAVGSETVATDGTVDVDVDVDVDVEIVVVTSGAVDSGLTGEAGVVASEAGPVARV